MIKHSQSTQRNKFAISLQYLKKEVMKEVHFLHVDEHQSFYKLGLYHLYRLCDEKISWAPTLAERSNYHRNFQNFSRVLKLFCLQQTFMVMNYKFL